MSDSDTSSDAHIAYHDSQGKNLLENKNKTTETDSFKLTEAELQNLAKRTVQAWIDSPNHNWIISCSLAHSCTVTTVIKKRGKNFSLTVSYHAKNKSIK